MYDDSTIEKWIKTTASKHEIYDSPRIAADPSPPSASAKRCAPDETWPDRTQRQNHSPSGVGRQGRWTKVSEAAIATQHLELQQPGLLSSSPLTRDCLARLLHKPRSRLVAQSGHDPAQPVHPSVRYSARCPIQSTYTPSRNPPLCATMLRWGSRSS